MSEPVSDDDLEKLVAWGWTDLTSVVVELRARRTAEQAVLPAVEEMDTTTETLLRTLWGCTWKRTRARESEESDWRDLALPIIASALTPLYAKLADLEQQLARNQQFAADQGQAIAERDAVLGECREQVNAWYEFQEKRMCVAADAFTREEFSAVKSQCDETLDAIASIDALLGVKGGEDGT